MEVDHLVFIPAARLKLSRLDFLFFLANTFEGCLVGRLHIEEATGTSIPLDPVAGRRLRLAPVLHCADTLTVAGRVVFCHVILRYRRLRCIQNIKSF